MVRIPTDGPPTHPEEMLLEEFLKRLSMSQVDLAEKIGISYQPINEVVRGKRGFTPDTALRSFPRSQENPQNRTPAFPRDSGNS